MFNSSNATALLGGMDIGAFTNANGTLQIIFNDNATRLVIDNVLQQITYTNISDAPPSSVTLIYDFHDGGPLNPLGQPQGPGAPATVLGDITINIAPVNDAPAAATPIPDQSSAEDAGWSYQVPAGTFMDVDGDTLSYTATLGNGSALPGWLSFNAATRTFSGTPPSNFNGALDLKVTASDGTLAASDTFTLTVTAVNDTPTVANAIPDQSVGEDAGWSYQVPTGTFTDVDGDTLSYAAALGNGDPLPGWLSFTAATRTFSGTPPLNFNGALDLKVTASDGTLAASDTFTLTVTAVNDAPIITSNGGGNTATVSIAENSVAVTTVVATDPDAATTLSHSIVGGADQTKFQINPSTGALSFIAPPNFELPTDADHNNSYVVQVQVSDNGAPNLSDSQTITVTVTDANEAPTAVALANATAGLVENTSTANRVKVADIVVGDDALGTNVLALTGTDAASFEVAGTALYLKAGVVLNYESKASYAVAVAVDDTAVGATPDAVSATYTLQVANINEAPTGTVTITGTVTEDQTLTANTATLADPEGLGAFHYQWKRNGTTNVGSDQSTYTLGDNDVGQSISVVVSYTDGNGTPELATSGTVGPVINVNDLPVAQNGAVTGHRNTAIPGNTAATDVDPSPMLTFSLFGVNGGALHGSVALGANGHFTYTPAINYIGPDSFQFQVNDGSANSNNPGTISVVVDAGGSNFGPPLNDFNGDGKADILLQHSGGTPAVWLMDGTTAQLGQSAINPGPTWHVKGSGDVDGDGKSEILWQNDSGLPAIWTMNGTNFAGGALLFNPGASWHIQEAADFNSDGKSDILWQNDDGTPAIWLMDGATMTSAALLVNPSPSWHVKAAADFNNDGKADILWQNDNGTPAIWLMDGLTMTSAVQLANPGTTWHAKAAADFDHDGKADILWQNDSGLPEVWKMDGLTKVSATSLINPGSSWYAVEAFDMNGDGKADIQWQNDNGTPAVWLMDGVTMTSAAILPNPTPDWHLI